MEIMSAAILLFLIMDPLGNLPIFIALLHHLSPKRQRRILIREMILALLTLLLFLYTGHHILCLLQLRLETLSISGGLILLLIALRMIFPQSNGVMGSTLEEAPFLVPLAIPLIAGPAALAAMLLLAHQHAENLLLPTLALLLAWSASLIILLLSNYWARRLGEQGIKAMERLMGLVLLMMSTQMLLDGLKGYLKA